VPEFPAAVADTHALLFHAGGSPKLGARAAAHFALCEQQQALLYIPAAVLWEVSVLTRAGRFNLRRSLRQFFTDLFSNPAYQEYALTVDQIVDADGLRLNRDPFDGLIVAAARAHDLPLLTRDAEIGKSGAVRTIW
jgi:PIN domain nuclease of toxin-antitoxin system